MAPRILIVCTANVCRSPYAADKLRTSLSADPSTAALEFIVESAGTHAVDDQSYCQMATKRIGEQHQGVSRHLESVDLGTFDLILTMSRNQRGEIVRLAPQLRSRIYTLVEVSRQAYGITQDGQALDVARGKSRPKDTGHSRQHVELLPSGNQDRWNWLLEEMNAWRGFFAGGVARHQSLDVNDPHIVSKDIHDDTFEIIDEAIAAFVKALSATLNA